jgi:single-strand DNA-binding protein
MNGFVIHGAVGRLAKDPQYVADASTPYCNFLLIRSDYAGKEREETITRLPCVAFNGIGRAIGTHARKGDQLILSIRIRNNDREENGKTHFGYSFVVESFEFGAPGQIKRQELNQRSSRD